MISQNKNPNCKVRAH